jgi:serine protease Do
MSDGADAQADARRASPAAKRHGFSRRLVTLLVCAAIVVPVCAAAADTIDDAQSKVVKIYGAGGFRGLEPYQTGVLISPDGHVLTVWSHVLDTDYLSVTLADGSKLDARLLGADPRLEIAVLKVDRIELPHFDLSEAVDVGPGTKVLALSNLFGVATGNEPVSVQQGVIAVKTPLSARRGVFETPYTGPVYVVDAVTNNPGAAGGALMNRQGKLVGLLGKELRNSRNNTWLNYAIPIAELRESVDQIRSGRLVARTSPPEKKPAKSLRLEMLGLVLVPEVVERTPPYVDLVRRGSPAAAAGIQPDDLVVLVGDHLVQSCRALRDELEYIDYEDEVRLTLLRGQELREVTLRGNTNAEP